MTLPDSQALPIARRKNRKQRKVAPATQAERDALQFAAINAEFDWTNEHWSETWLPWVRLAAVHVGGDQDRLQEAMREIVADGRAPNLLEGLTRTKKHLEGLEKLIGIALTRSFLILERLGYSPDNQPPDSRVH
jgi:hypothetical protein